MKPPTPTPTLPRARGKQSDWRDWPVRATRRFAPDHPALAGHFPGHPVLPGALLLDWACAELAGAQPLTLREARFTHPCGPGSLLALRAKTDENGGTRFAVTLEEGGAEVLAVSGALLLPLPQAGEERKT